MKDKTITVLICAYNEEKNIGSILDQVLGQAVPHGYQLEKIIVVSDASTDKTNRIVLDYRNHLIELKINKDRMGKARAFNEGKSNVASDYLISLDADVSLHEEAFLHLLPGVSDSYDLAACSAIPSVHRSSTIASLASYGTYYLLEGICSVNTNAIFRVRGILLLLSRNLYSQIELPDAPGTDQYMYWSCLKTGGIFAFRPNAIAYYSVPTKIADYMKQNHCFAKALVVQEKIFGKEFVHKYDIGLLAKLRILAKVFFMHPISIFCWAALFSYSKLRLIGSRNNVSGIWEIVQSTK